MTEEKNAPSFGRYLMDVRLDRHISLEAISQETRISPTVLRLIEQEDHKRLPDEVFVKGFVRAYAQSLGLDATQVVKQYLLDLKAYQEAFGGEKDRRKLMFHFWLRLILVIGALLVLIGLTLSGVRYYQELVSSADLQQPLSTESLHEAKHLPGYTEKESAATRNEIPSTRLLLKIVALEKTWIKVMIDGRDFREYHLNAQDSLQLEASSGFNLLIANPAAIKLTFNGKPVPVYGLPGQFANVQLP